MSHYCYWLPNSRLSTNTCETTTTIIAVYHAMFDPTIILHISYSEQFSATAPTAFSDVVTINLSQAVDCDAD